MFSFLSSGTHGYTSVRCAAIIAAACSSVLGGCQSIPDDLATTDVMTFAQQTYDVAGVSSTLTKSYSASTVFAAVYTEQAKATVTLPSATHAFEQYAMHCYARNGTPRLIDGVTLVCIEKGEIQYAMNAARIDRDRVALQVVQPVIQGPIRTDPQFISDYAAHFFNDHLGQLSNADGEPLALTQSDRRRFRILGPAYEDE